MKSAHIGIIAMVLAAFPSRGVLCAQGAPPLTPGQRVRVTAPSAGLDHAVGTIRAANGREIVIGVRRFQAERGGYGGRTDTLNVVVSLDSLRSMEVVIGTRTHFWLGAGIGAAIVGLPLGFWGATSRGFFTASPGLAAAGLFGGGLVGGLLGGIVGATIVTDRWGNVPLGGDRLSLRVAPNGRLGLGASFTL
jgi:hypothetical protein